MGQRRSLRVPGASRLVPVVDAILSVTLAPTCAACASVLDHPSAGPVCGACWTSIRSLAPPLCRTCGDPLQSWRVLDPASGQCARCRRIATAVDAARTAGEYEGHLREIIHAFKYDGRRSLATPLGCRMREAAADLLADADCAVAVPLHAIRRLERGFNQASDLAATLNLPVVKALRRARRTQPQAGLTARARRRNVANAFRLSPLLSRRTQESLIVDRVVVLVDDVRTTGATLNACASVLKAAGAREVRAVTAAAAITRRHAPARAPTSLYRF